MRAYGDAQWAWLGQAYRDGYPLNVIAAFAHLNVETVRRNLMRMGLMPECRRELPPLEERRQEFLELEEPS